MQVFLKNIFYSKKSLLFLEAGLKKNIDKRSIKPKYFFYPIKIGDLLSFR